MNQDKNVTLAKWLLRFGIAFVYGYAAIEIYFNPNNFLKYVPQFVQNMLPIDIFLLIFEIFEIILTLWLLSGFKTEYAGIISLLIMIGIISFNLEYFNVLFRNVAIAFASLVLFVLDHKPIEEKMSTQL